MLVRRTIDIFIKTKKISHLLQRNRNFPVPASQKYSTETIKRDNVNNDHFYFNSGIHQEKSSWMEDIRRSMIVHPDFVTSIEEEQLLAEIEPYLRRLHYESSHWDDAIHDYRETERKHWNKKNTIVINRIREIAFPPTVKQLQFVHVLDLAQKGVIKPHIDSVRFCGDTIAGLSLLSDSIMRLRLDTNKSQFVDVFLPRLSLYIMNGLARYDYTHEILGETESFFSGRKVQRERRISIMCRNEPHKEDELDPTPNFSRIFKSAFNEEEKKN